MVRPLVGIGVAKREIVGARALYIRNGGAIAAHELRPAISMSFVLAPDRGSEAKGTMATEGQKLADTLLDREAKPFPFGLGRGFLPRDNQREKAASIRMRMPLVA